MNETGKRSTWLVALACLALGLGSARGDEASQRARYEAEVLPLLEDTCFECHATGIKKGSVSLDEFPGGDPLRGSRDLWWRVLKNVRSGLMPPADKDRPSKDEVAKLESWIKQAAFGIDPNDPDPGRVTLRRLNRVEYRNTIRDLMGIDFRADEEFPPDDTGYGFDTIGDVLTVSPLLLEKYLQAAEAIVNEAVPRVSRVVRVETISGSAFRDRSSDSRDTRLSFYKPAKRTHSIEVDQPGKRRLTIEVQVRGQFDFDPGRCRLTLKLDGEERLNEQFKWQDGKVSRFPIEVDWNKGRHEFTFELEPLTPIEEKKNELDLRIVGIKIEGPLEPEKWGRPKNFDRFFTHDAPKTAEGRREYTRATLKRFATRAFRRPVDDAMLDRLSDLAQSVYEQPGKSVEDGLAKAMVAVLASPRFLFRIEANDPKSPAKGHPPVDEYALASRLSYFLWSTMPDAELFQRAERGELRATLREQVKRMVADGRSRTFVENFTGQWLQARDVEGIAIDARTVLARDDGEEKELKKELEEFRAFLAQREAEQKALKDKPPAEQQKAQQGFRGQFRGRFRRLFGSLRADLDAETREAMRRETELFFGGIVVEDRSVLDLIDSDYTYLNEKLARYYGIPDVKGSFMRKVSLPKDSPRGGLLTQGTMLLVTSNPTRTSPVKRGLFILDNILGTPAPPAPAGVPQLEEADKPVDGREPTLREVLEIHRREALCNACHVRMDPLGLALENFNAMGLWRDKERGQPIDAGGQLITGESFDGIRELKKVLKDKHKFDFYRCLTEKLMTYALGRGLEYYDVEAVDRIVAQLDADGGKFSTLLVGVVESSPFQKRRASAVQPSPTP